MFFWVALLSICRANPANSIVLLHNILKEKQEIEQQLLLHETLQKKSVRPQALHALADAMMQKPSVMAMLNRYSLEPNIAKEAANGNVEISTATSHAAKWFWIEEEGERKYLMVAIRKKEMYPVKDPFSSRRNDVLFDSIRHLKSDCVRFSGAIDGVLRKWEGQACSYGNVWMEWDPTKEYIFRVLIQFREAK